MGQVDILPLEVDLHVEDALRNRQPRDQLFLVHRLDQEVVGTGPEGLELVPALVLDGQHDDVAVRDGRPRADEAAQLEAVDLGHHPVCQDEPPVVASERASQAAAAPVTRLVSWPWASRVRQRETPVVTWSSTTRILIGSKSHSRLGLATSVAARA